MKSFRFKGVLTEQGWQQDACVTVDPSGKITSLSRPVENAEIVNGYAVPGWQNAHSHAFQYAMAGLAEKHQSGNSADDFWSWREAMYQLALTISPDDLEAIACMLYSEMVRHGYTQVAEFHYLHHDKNGKPYVNLAEHGERLVAAAQKAGIKITLVPMFYQQGGFGQSPQPRQRRFISPTTDAYIKLFEASQQAAQGYDGASVGYGIHSLRAVNNEAFIEVCKANLAGPFHIHIAEQLKEIDDCVNYYGQRPVEWLLNHVEVSENYHLVHATHLSEDETVGIAKSGAHVVLCPSTEGNLGDGIFPLRRFIELGGKWSIGTDSHIGLNPCEELRILDYGQRLISHKRNTFTSATENDSASYAFHQTLVAGRSAMGNSHKRYFQVGASFDAVVYDADQPLLATASQESILATIVYASDVSWNLGTLVNGEWVVQANQPKNKHAIQQDFVKAINGLGVR